MTTITITQTFTSKTRNGGGGVPPSNTIAPVISGSSDIGSVLTTTDGTWTGTAPITYSYQWNQNGNPIIGETNSTYTLVVADYLKDITCEVTATNVAGSANATSNAITCTGVAPANTVAPVISGTPTVGQTLSSTTGTWTGTVPITYTYQWKRAGSDIVGATSSTYILVQADATFAVTCVVTGTNIAGSANATSNSLTIIDADASAFFTASGLTGATNQSAINQLVVSLKGFGIWTKMKAIYPMIGGTAALHKWNLKDPQDTNAAFRLVFSGGWTHSSTGALPNGVNAYANTFLVPNTILTQNSTHISYYSRTNTNLTEIEIGASNGPNAADNKLVLEIRTANVTYYNINSTSTYITHADTDSKAFYVGNRTASNVVNGWRNGSKLATGTTASTAPSTASVYLGAFNRTSSVGFYSTKQCAFSSLGDGLTDADVGNLYTAVQAFNTTLGRQV
jgi:hypothetical protein